MPRKVGALPRSIGAHSDGTRESRGLSRVLAHHQEPRRLEVILVINIKKRIDLADGKVDRCERIAGGEDIDLAHAAPKRLPKRVADADGPEPEDRMSAALRGRRGELETPVASAATSRGTRSRGRNGASVA